MTCQRCQHEFCWYCYGDQYNGAHKPDEDNLCGLRLLIIRGLIFFFCILNLNCFVCYRFDHQAWVYNTVIGLTISFILANGVALMVGIGAVFSGLLIGGKTYDYLVKFEGRRNKIIGTCIGSLCLIWIYIAYNLILVSLYLSTLGILFKRALDIIIIELIIAVILSLVIGILYLSRSYLSRTSSTFKKYSQML